MPRLQRGGAVVDFNTMGVVMVRGEDEVELGAEVQVREQKSAHLAYATAVKIPRTLISAPPTTETSPMFKC